ncbi:hypothetical protein [Streptomyces sp. Wb2n-11]|uniref:hypothetical protein n=1 Tax=Streptomyces sp. Wb2n-11 TaxID=1030533 RepID=UPI0011471AB1|nr:hypothetical protein [Streptomyces sp. Wb2n-11]
MSRGRSPLFGSARAPRRRTGAAIAVFCPLRPGWTAPPGAEWRRWRPAENAATASGGNADEVLDGHRRPEGKRERAAWGSLTERRCA